MPAVDPDVAAYFAAKKQPAGDVDPDVAAYFAAKEKPSAAESFGRGAMQGGTAGFGDEIAGASGAASSSLADEPDDSALGSAAKHAVGALLPGGNAVEVGNAVNKLNPTMRTKGILDKYRSIRDQEREANKAAEEAHGGYYLGGEIAGTLPSMLIPGAGAAKGAKLGARLGRSAVGGILQGAVGGLGNSEADLTKGDVEGAERDTLAGGAIGGALGGVGHLVGEGLGAIPKGLRNMAERRAFKSTAPSAAVVEKVRGNPGGLQQAGRDILNADLPQWESKEARLKQIEKLSDMRAADIGNMVREVDQARGGASIPVQDIANDVRRNVIAPMRGRPGLDSVADELEGHLQLLEKQAGLGQEAAHIPSVSGAPAARPQAPTKMMNAKDLGRIEKTDRLNRLEKIGLKQKMSQVPEGVEPPIPEGTAATANERFSPEGTQTAPTANARIGAGEPTQSEASGFPTVAGRSPGTDPIKDLLARLSEIEPTAIAPGPNAQKARLAGQLRDFLGHLDEMEPTSRGDPTQIDHVKALLARLEGLDVEPTASQGTLPLPTAAGRPAPSLSTGEVSSVIHEPTIADPALGDATKAWPRGPVEMPPGVSPPSKPPAPVPGMATLEQIHRFKVDLNNAMDAFNARSGFPGGSDSAGAGRRAMQKVSERLSNEMNAAGRGGEWAEANRQHGNWKDILKGAEIGARREFTNRFLSPTDYAGGAILGAAGGAFADDNRGRGAGIGALAGAALTHHVMRTRGNQVIAPILDKIGATLQAGGALAGKLPPAIALPLQNAMKRGPSSFAAVHYVMTQNSPEYREFLRATSDSNE